MMRARTTDELQATLVECGLSSYSQRILERTRPGIILRSSPKAESSIPIGASKLGGLPDLPSTITWPTKQGADGAALSFVAQINLADIALHDKTDLLPRIGMLWFFYDLMAGGFDPKDKDSFAVIYRESSDELKRREYPAPIEKKILFGLFKNRVPLQKFNPCVLSAESSLTLPDDSPVDPDDDDACDAYYDLIAEIQPGHQMLGYPAPVQGEIEYECELVSNGLYCGDATGYKDPRAKELEKRKDRWELLLQVDSDEAADMMWGDLGRLYFCIPREDLQARNFEKTWLIMQCH